jgi:capsular polysaccharide biosynthesis protein
MADTTPAHARELGDYAALARRRWAWILLCVVAGGAFAFAYLSLAQETYVSTAKVLVESTGDASTAEGARMSDAVNLDTEAQLMTSAPVSTRAATLLASPLSPVALARRVSVTVPPNTTVMAVHFAGPSATEAQRGAAMFAQAYLENRQESAQDELAADVDRLEARIKETTADIQDLSVAIARSDGTSERTDRAFLVARRATLSAQLASYNGELAPLVGGEVNPGELILEAQLPSTPVDPNPWLILPAGLMAGLVVGLGLAARRERSDKRIHSAAEVERLFGIIPLSNLSAVGRGRDDRLSRGVRALYHTLRATGPDTSDVVMVVGPDATVTAEHLGYSLALVAARSGSETAYVTRPGSPTLDRWRSEAENIGALQLPDYEQLGVVVDGEIRPAKLREELRELEVTRDFLLLGLPNEDPAVGLPILGRHVNLAVTVIELGVTRRDTVAEVLADLTKCGVDQVFAVTVDLRRRRFRRGGVGVETAFADPSGHPVLIGLGDEQGKTHLPPSVRNDAQPASATHSRS